MIYLKRYDDIKECIELLKILKEAEKDVENKRIAPIQDTFDDLRIVLQEN